VRVALASADEVDAAIDDAAQGVWLISRDMDEIARLLSLEHGKTFPDAKGDTQRGLEVVDFFFASPHLLKGEYSDSMGPAAAGRRSRRG
jgi:malonate-semialdehyde dehydrogenase (acetylating) / methylmalonate-semialdehyde dehydrogenase